MKNLLFLDGGGTIIIIVLIVVALIAGICITCCKIVFQSNAYIIEKLG